MTTNKTVAVVLAALLVLSGMGVGSVQAQDSGDEDDSLLDRLLDAGPGSILSGLWGAVEGMSDRIGTRYLGEEVSPEECKEDLMQELEAEREHYLDAVNSRINASTARDVVAVRCVRQLDNGSRATATFYVTAVVTEGSSNYSDLSIRESTSRQVDHTIELSDVARKEFADDLETFGEDYLKGEKELTTGYKARMYEKYKGSVRGSFSFLPALDGGAA